MRHTFNLDLSPESNSKEGNTGNTLPSLLSSEDLATFVYDWNLGQKVRANSDYTFYSVHKKGQTLFFESISAHPLFVKVWHWNLEVKLAISRVLRLKFENCKERR